MSGIAVPLQASDRYTGKTQEIQTRTQRGKEWRQIYSGRRHRNTDEAAGKDAKDEQGCVWAHVLLSALCVVFYCLHCSAPCNLLQGESEDRWAAADSRELHQTSVLCHQSAKRCINFNLESYSQKYEWKRSTSHRAACWYFYTKKQIRMPILQERNNYQAFVADIVSQSL